MGRFNQSVKKRLRYSVVALAAVLSLVAMPLLAPIVTQAQSADSQGLQVSPVIIDLNSEKGGNYSLKLTVTNVTTNILDITSSTNDFTASDETGNPKVVTDANAPESTYSLRSWVAPIAPFTLKPKESRTMNVAVNVPQNAESGGHYGVIRFSGVPPQGGEGSRVSLNASVGTLLLARVAGNINEKLVIKNMSAQKNGKNTGLVSNGPVNIVTQISNTGNVHVKPVGTLTVKDTFGKTVGSYPFGSNTKNVLPGTTRKYEQNFDKRFMFGRYTAHVEAGYGTTGGVLIGDTTFWVIPYKLIFFVLIIIAVLVLISRKLIKRYEKRILRKAQKTSKNKEQ